MKRSPEDHGLVGQGPVLVVLPPREGFAPGAAGAVGMVVRRLALEAGSDTVVAGAPQPASFAGIPYHAVRPGWGLRPPMRYAAGVAHLARQLRPRLIEVHNRPEVARGIAARCPDIPVSLFLHNDPSRMRGMETPARRAALRRQLAGVVAVSDYIANCFGSDTKTLHNALMLEEIPPARKHRDTVILFVGRIVADKGADLFVSAMAEVLPDFPDWRAEMIGADRFRQDAPETPFIAGLRPRAEAAGIALRGYCPHGAVLDAMAHAAVVVVPSRWQEPFGMTALEAMACGAALICSDRGGLPEVVGDAAILLDPEQPGTLVSALRNVLRDPARRAAMGLAGRQRAMRFTAAGAASALSQIRQEMLNG